MHEDEAAGLVEFIFVIAQNFTNIACLTLRILAVSQFDGGTRETHMSHDMCDATDGKA